MPHDLFYVVIFFVFILIIILVTETLAKESFLPREISRKILHIVTGITVGLLPVFTDNILSLLITGVISLLLTSAGVFFSWFPSIAGKGRRSWGIIFYPVTFIFFLLILPYEKIWLLSLSFFIVALSDGMAAIMGYSFSEKFFRLTGDKKSIIGSVTFFVFTNIVILSVVHADVRNILINYNGIEEFSVYLLITSISVSLILTIFEALSSSGTDNLTVPIVGAFLLSVFLSSEQYDLLTSLIIGIILGSVIGVISYRLKFLTLNGSVATMLLATFVYGFGGLQWTIPIIAFFLLSSMLSKVRKKYNPKVEQLFDKSGQRDIGQVLANGGLGGILVLLYTLNPNDIYYYIYVATIAAVCADTWATEIGTLWKQKTYSILTFRHITQGQSGGVSLVGSLGAVIGAIVIALCSFYWLTGISVFIYIVLAGVAGSFFDSFIGATLQAQRECVVCNLSTERMEHCNKQTEHVSGVEWINNDLVNLFAGCFGGLLLFIIYL